MRNLIRWNPRNELENADPFRAMEQMMEEVWRNLPARFSLDTRNPMLRPAMDVVENDKEVAIRIDLPGLKPDDVKVELEDNTLTISGEIGDTIEKEGDRFHYRERSYGAFQRSLRLPNTVDAEHVGADFENGVLTITLPKLPQAQPRQISVNSSGKNQ